MEKKLKRVYQVIDKRGHYRSIITSNGEIVDFISEDSKDAIVYTYDELKKVITYYAHELNIPVMIETKRISKGKLC